MRLQFFCDFDRSVFAIDLPMTDPPASKAYSSETIAAVDFLLVSVLRLDYLATTRSDAPSEKRVIFDQTLLSETNIAFQCLSLIMRFEERLELNIIHLGATAGLEAIKWRLDPSMTGEHQLLKRLYCTLRTIPMRAIIWELHGLRMIKANINRLVAFNLIREADWTKICLTDSRSLKFLYPILRSFYHSFFDLINFMPSVIIVLIIIING